MIDKDRKGHVNFKQIKLRANMYKTKKKMSIWYFEVIIEFSLRDGAIDKFGCEMYASWNASGTLL